MKITLKMTPNGMLGSYYEGVGPSGEKYSTDVDDTVEQLEEFADFLQSVANLKRKGPGGGNSTAEKPSAPFAHTRLDIVDARLAERRSDFEHVNDRLDTQVSKLAHVHQELLSLKDRVDLAHPELYKRLSNVERIADRAHGRLDAQHRRDELMSESIRDLFRRLIKLEEIHGG